MVAKRFGALNLTANTPAVLMTGVANTNSTVNVRFCNRGNVIVKVRLALVDDTAGTAIASLSNEDYLEYDTSIMANEVLENTGLAIPAGHSLVVRSDTVNVNVIAYGYEEKII